MGRKSGSYKFEKRQKEINKQKRRKEKMERRQNKPDDGDEPVPATPAGLLGAMTEE